MDTLHPGAGRIIQGISKKLSEADSKNRWGWSSDLSQVPKEDENPHFYRGRRGNREDPILLGCYPLFPLVVINSDEYVVVRTWWSRWIEIAVRKQWVFQEIAGPPGCGLVISWIQVPPAIPFFRKEKDMSKGKKTKHGKKIKKQDKKRK